MKEQTQKSSLETSLPPLRRPSQQKITQQHKLDSLLH